MSGGWSSGWLLGRGGEGGWNELLYTTHLSQSKQARKSTGSVSGWEETRQTYLGILAHVLSLPRNHFFPHLLRGFRGVVLGMEWVSGWVDGWVGGRKGGSKEGI